MWLSNSLYLLLTVAFIEMCRALLPLFVMTSLYLTGLETPTATLVKAVALTGLGCLISAYGEVCVCVGGVGRQHVWEQASLYKARRPYPPLLGSPTPSAGVCVCVRRISPPSSLQVNLSVLGLLCLGGNFSFEAARLVLMQVPGGGEGY